MARLFDPLNAAIEIYSRLNRMGTSIRRILEVIETVPNVAEQPGAIQIPSPVRGHVELKMFFSRTAPGNPSCMNLTSVSRLARSGACRDQRSGKSTIAKLIARLYDADRGAVHIDGIDVRNIKLKVFGQKSATSCRSQFFSIEPSEKTCC